MDIANLDRAAQIAEKIKRLHQQIGAIMLDRDDRFPNEMNTRHSIEKAEHLKAQVLKLYEEAKSL